MDSLNIPPLDSHLNSLPLWFLEFEDKCEKKGLTEKEQYMGLLKQIPDFLQNKVLNITRESFSDGSYKRLKDALIDAVNPKASDEVDYSNADLIGVIKATGTGGVNARNIQVITTPPANLPQDRRLIQGHIGQSGEAKVTATGDIVLDVSGGQHQAPAAAGNDKLGSSSDRRTVQNHISTEGTSKVKAMENFNCYASAEAVAAIAKAASTSKAIEASDVKVEPDSFYELGNSSGDPKRGKLIIFNFKEYPNADDERTGTEMDAEALKETFEMLNFNIEPLENTLNRTSEQLHAYLNYVSTSIGKHYHCLVIAILAHGEKGQFFCSDGKSFTYDDLYAYFTECPALVGKPKIFLIQACRGRKFDEGVKTDEMQLRLNPNADPNVIPNTADFLKVYSCCPDYRAIRSELNGSWFIQALCRIINENWQRKTLVDMVMMTQTDVAGQEAIVGYSIARKWALEHSVKQMVVYESTLRKKIKF